MASYNCQQLVECRACSWRGRRVFKEDGYGACGRCQAEGTLHAALTTVQARKLARARQELARYAGLALVLLVCASGCRPAHNYVDEATQLDAQLRRPAVPVAGCGAVDPPIPVYHRGRDHVAFQTRMAWCAGFYVKADDVVYADGRRPIAGDIIECQVCHLPLSACCDLELRPEDRPK